MDYLEDLEDAFNRMGDALDALDDADDQTAQQILTEAREEIERVLSTAPYSADCEG